ncbi:hypothetical protein O9G_005020 [Rozella allomycis CSF55]|uniref:Uncharacterized protein n=1 Tax=Rozella allomycis (strain CSF55) TaxID=988480 RepID=A0A075B0Q4_ROZAC|nr:hypothetical protein O9G_005020 [Rozella allomycis CSF55]|eukprot:EPZ36119.1 hypothetical protein O9G_005020 [Rozella allomycis CSF55]
MTNVATLWSVHRAKLHDINNYSQNASVVYVPTAGGGSGDNLSQFFSESHCSPFDVAVSDPELISTVSEGNQIVQEWVLKVDHKNGTKWLVPNVEATRKIINLALVFIVSYAGEKIDSLRVYWDQGTVVKQLGLLGNDPKASIVNAAILDGQQSVRRVLNSTEPAHPTVSQHQVHQSPKKVHSNYHYFAKSSGTSQMGSILSGEEEVKVRPSTRVNSSFVGGKSSNIFNNEPEQFKPSSHIDPRRYQDHFRNDGVAGEELSFHPGRKMNAASNNASHFTLGGSNTELNEEKPARHVRGSAKANTSSWSFGGNEREETQQKST